MMGTRKPALALLLAGLLLSPAAAWEREPPELPAAAIRQEVEDAQRLQLDLKLPVRSAILIDQNTGAVWYEQNPDEPLPPASVTKVMSLLLFMEALEAGKIHPEDRVPCSDFAAGYGGSEIWLKPGEEMTVEELLKAVAVQSANDATVCLAEHTEGSAEAFIAEMNRRAAELGMEHTHFSCAEGLDQPDHYSTARDIAVMSRELMTHPQITDYTTIWMDSLREGATSLVNTNRLIRFYQGATGLKTGTTSKAGCCLSATAERDGLGLVAVVLGAKTSNDRFAAARALLDWGFANLAAVKPEPPEAGELPVTRGAAASVPLETLPPAEGLVLLKTEREALAQTLELPEAIEAPVEAGQVLGRVVVTAGGRTLTEYPVQAAEAVPRMTYGLAFSRLGQALLGLPRRA